MCACRGSVEQGPVFVTYDVDKYVAESMIVESKQDEGSPDRRRTGPIPFMRKVRGLFARRSARTVLPGYPVSELGNFEETYGFAAGPNGAASLNRDNSGSLNGSDALLAAEAAGADDAWEDGIWEDADPLENGAGQSGDLKSTGPLTLHLDVASAEEDLADREATFQSNVKQAREAFEKSGRVNLHHGADLLESLAFLRGARTSGRAVSARVSGRVGVSLALCKVPASGTVHGIHFETRSALVSPGRGGCDTIYMLPFGPAWFPSAFYSRIALTTGKWYFEVAVRRMTHGLFQVGWADASLHREPQQWPQTHGVGDFDKSWAFDGGRQLAWHDGASVAFGEQFDRRRSAIVGCAVDIEAGQISFSYAGSWDAPNGVAFRDVEIQAGLQPALSAHKGSLLEVNLGQRAFVHAPPDASYQSVHSWVVNSQLEPVPKALPAGLGNNAAQPALRSLSLANTGLSVAVLRVLLSDAHGSLGCLRDLSLEGNYLGAAPRAELEAFVPVLKKAAPNLVALNVRGNALGVSGLSALSDVFGQLESLVVDKNGLCGPVGGAELGQVVRAAPRLRSLSACGNFLGDTGCVALLEAILEAEAPLESLRLEKNDAGEALATWFGANGPKLAHLANLNLRSNTRMGPAFAALLSGASNLTRLDLGWLGIGSADLDDLLQALRGAPRLEWLGLGGSHLSLAACAKLFEALRAAPGGAKESLPENYKGKTSVSRDMPCLRGVDLSGLRHSRAETLQLLEEVAKTPHIRECILSGNRNVDQGVALHLIDMFMQSERVPAVRFDATGVGEATAKALFAFSRARACDGMDDQRALERVFRRAWPVKRPDLPAFRRLFDWLEALSRRERAAAALAAPEAGEVFPELRIEGDFVVRPQRDGPSLEPLVLPRRVHVLGNAKFVGCAEAFFDNVDKFTVDGMLWLEDCARLKTLPKNVVVGKHLVVYNMPVSAIRITPRSRTQGLDLVHLIGLRELTSVDAQVRAGTVRVERCPRLKAVPVRAAKTALILSACDAVAEVAEAQLEVLIVERCKALVTSKARVSSYLSARYCEHLRGVGAFALQRAEFAFCPALPELRVLPSEALVLRDCPLISKLPAGVKRIEDIAVSHCRRLELPKGLVVTRRFLLEACPRVRELPPGTGRAAEEFTISVSVVARLPAKVEARSVELRHCSLLAELGAGNAPLSLTVEACASLLALRDDNVSPPLARATPGDEADGDADAMVFPTWTLSRCRALSVLPATGRLEALDLDLCPRLQSIPPNLRFGELSLTRCGLRRLGGEDPSHPLVVQRGVTVCSCPSLQIIDNLHGRRLAVEDCVGLTRIGAPPSGPATNTLRVRESMLLRNLPNLRDLSSSVPATCRAIEISESSIPRQRLVELEAAARECGNEVDWFEGDQFDYVIGDEGAGFADLKSAVRFWEKAAAYEGATHELTPLVPKYYLGDVLKFLSKLRMAAEFQREETREGLARRVVEVFSTLRDDDFSREEILTRMVDSIDRCGDKPIWALNQITLTTRVAKARGDKRALRELGHAIMRLDIVHRHARNKIDEMGGDVDDVCVYLKYEIDLREDLDLPVSAQHMLFPAYIKIKKRELAVAREEAMAISDADLDVWLAQWPEWQRQLRLEFAGRVTWDKLPQAKVNKRVSASLTSFAGDPMSDPVMLGRSGPWNFGELMDRWVATGMDFSNVRWDVAEFEAALGRIIL